MAHRLILFGFLLCTRGTLSMKTLNHVTVRTGGNVTIPCLYDDQYKLNQKYWCEGHLWTLCQIKAHTNKTAKWQVTDYPAKNIFTVQLNNLSASDSGYHWCAVEIGTHANPDDKESLYLTVKTDPDVSVVSSSVTGLEGGNISVQCFYSFGYKTAHKRWCRFKDKICYKEGRTNTSQNSSVQISDDGRESFTVLMTGLTESDSGWYWCSVGDLEVPVQLFVQWDNGALVTQAPDATSMTEGPLCYDTVVFKKGKDHDQDQISTRRPADQDYEVIYSAVKLH